MRNIMENPSIIIIAIKINSGGNSKKFLNILLIILLNKRDVILTYIVITNSHIRIKIRRADIKKITPLIYLHTSCLNNLLLFINKAVIETIKEIVAMVVEFI